MTETERQELIDAYYHAHGPCCAGCDWWRSLNAFAGLCTRTAPIAGRDRGAMLGIESSSLKVGAGHAFTKRDHVCGEFRDNFDWTTLPPHYLRRVGFIPGQKEQP
jgi:hypothetical protein